MKFYPRWTATALFVIALDASSVANAALVSRLGGLAVYDTDLNITWLADANYVYTSGYTGGLNSGLNWWQANTWAWGLTVDGISGWRLPPADPVCGGTYNIYNCTGSEMGKLFYNELGGVAGQAIFTNHNANYNLFTNIQAGPLLAWDGGRAR